MSVTTYGGLYYPDGDKSSVPAETKLMQESVRHRAVIHFSAPSTRDTATAALLDDIPTATGMVCHVTNKGWYGYDGPTATWASLDMEGVTRQTGVVDVTTTANGVFTIAHALGTAELACHFTLAYAGPSDVAALAVLNRATVHVRSITSTVVTCYVSNSETNNWYVSSAMVVHYNFTKLT